MIFHPAVVVAVLAPVAYRLPVSFPIRTPPHRLIRSARRARWQGT